MLRTCPLPDEGYSDRIKFTVGTWDLTPALWEQLAPGGVW